MHDRTSSPQPLHHRQRSYKKFPPSSRQRMNRSSDWLAAATTDTGLPLFMGITSFQEEMGKTKKPLMVQATCSAAAILNGLPC